MTVMARVLLLLFVLLCLGMERKGRVWAFSGKVLLVSMDGFRWDYVRKISGLGNFSRLAAEGCTVDYVDPVFITKSSPCHYSIATGLYTETHGIVANNMYDSQRNSTFRYRSPEEFWWGGEPIWVTAEKHNKSTATYFWPGSSALIQGYRPSIYKIYNGSVPFPERVETAIHWLADLKKDFVTLYFHEPDMTGHFFGPSSQQVANKVREMDGILGLILHGLDNKKLSDVVNVILTSDHGMTEISNQERLINLWDYINQTWVERVPDVGPTTGILPVAGWEDHVLLAAKKIPHASVYRREDVPVHFHYSRNERIMPIIIIAEEGWTVSTNVTRSLAFNDKGNHGYSNELSSMKPIFFARGPDFRKGVKSTSIRTVDIYPLLCRLLGVKAAPNNGSVEKTTHFLVDSTSSASQELPGCLGFLVFVMLFRE
ncbi:hypothetical protein ACOMHN_006222 [Nucella lapillus]